MRNNKSSLSGLMEEIHLRFDLPDVAQNPTAYLIVAVRQ